MKTGMGRGIKARDAQQIREAEIWSYTFFVFHFFRAFWQQMNTQPLNLVKSEKNNVTNKLE